MQFPKLLKSSHFHRQFTQGVERNLILVFVSQPERSTIGSFGWGRKALERLRELFELAEMIHSIGHARVDFLPPLIGQETSEIGVGECTGR
jgi:predicted transcriptional regulator